jgi:hypothetical protein
MNQPDLFAKARVELWSRRQFVAGSQNLTIAFLIREEDWRPLHAPWWREKQASIIGADIDGNFFLRHCDGSVRYWDHKAQASTILAKSINEFARQITEA